MDFSTLLQSIQTTLGENLPGILGALAILVLGWLVAIIVRAGVRKGLSLMKLNQGVAATTGTSVNLEGGVARGAYYLILFLALIGFFNALNLTLVSGPLQSLVDQVFTYAPRVAGAGVLALVAWVLAMLVRKLVTSALAATTLDDKLTAQAGMRPVSDSAGNVLYWLVILLFLPGVLHVLGLEGLLLPIQGMVDEVLTTLPNIFAALVIGFVGWFAARLLRDLVSNLLVASGANQLGERAGLRETMPLSKLIGLIVYILVIVPALIAALDALSLDAVSAPAKEMLAAVMVAIPNVFAATLIIVVAYYAASFVANLVTDLLGGVGFNEIPGKIGIQAAFSGNMTASRLIGKIIVFFAMVFATVEAANRLGFTQISGLVATFIQFGGQVLLGVLIIAIGLWIANLAAAALRAVSGGRAALYAGLARFAILGLVFAMALRAMGIATDIVNLAFGLTLGAVAVAVALSFGLGGREAAGRQMEHWLSKLRGER